MKKGLGKIRKIKKKHIFLALLAVIVLGGLAKAYSAWVGTTRIAFLNYQAIELGQISHANDNAMIKLSEITTDDFDHLDDYDMIIVNGAEKKYTVTLQGTLKDKTLTVNYSIQYGKMPQPLIGKFVCTK